jgi:hypothetical protein
MCIRINYVLFFVRTVHVTHTLCPVVFFFYKLVKQVYSGTKEPIKTFEQISKCPDWKNALEPYIDRRLKYYGSAHTFKFTRRLVSGNVERWYDY